MLREGCFAICVGTLRHFAKFRAIIIQSLAIAAAGAPFVPSVPSGYASRGMLLPSYPPGMLREECFATRGVLREAKPLGSAM
jgi:hypothetical protein